MKTTFGCERCSYLCELNTKTDSKDDIPKACPYLIVVPEWKIANIKKSTRRLEIMTVFLTLLWIFSWFIGIWIYPLQLFLTGLFALILALMVTRTIKDIESEQKV